MAEVWAITVLILCFVASASVTATRFYVRIRSSNRFRSDDYTILASLLLHLALAVAGVVQLVLVNGILFLKIFYSGTFLYFGTLWMVKISINLFHINLTARLGRINTAARFSLYFTYATGVIVLLLQIFGCWPIERRFISAGVEGCDLIQNSSIFWACFAFNLVTDIILIILPYPALLMISERRIRVIISVIFTLAGLIIIMTIVRAVLITVAPATNGTVIIVLSNLECGVLLGISALPGVSHFFTSKYLASSSHSGWRRTSDAPDASGRNLTLRSGHGLPTTSSATAITDMDGERPRNIETESVKGLEVGEAENGTWVSSGSSPSASFDLPQDGTRKGPRAGQILKKTTIQMEVFSREIKKP